MSFSPRIAFELSFIQTRVPSQAGVYIIYDLAGPIYVGRSRVSVRDRLIAHFKGRGNKNIRIAQLVGGSGSLYLRYLCGFGSVDQAEAILIEELLIRRWRRLARLHPLSSRI